MGYVLGRIVTMHNIPIDSISVSHDVREEIPVVSLDAVRDSNFVGSIRGNVRFFIDDEQVIASSDHLFSVPAGTLLTNEIGVIVPEWAQFVASKNGTKYYPVFSASGDRISPQNRLYFRSAAEAEGKGYKK